MIVGCVSPKKIGERVVGLSTIGLNVGNLSKQPWVVVRLSNREAYCKQYVTLGGNPDDNIADFGYYYEVHTD